MNNSIKNDKGKKKKASHMEMLVARLQTKATAKAIADGIFRSKLNLA